MKEMIMILIKDIVFRGMEKEFNLMSLNWMIQSFGV